MEYQTYTIPATDEKGVRSKGPLTPRRPGESADETPLYWLGSRDVVRAYTKGIEALLQQAKEDDPAPSFHWANYVAEAGLDPVQEYPLNISLASYGEQALIHWPRSLDEEEDELRFQRLRDKRILFNTNALALLQSAPDLATSFYSTKNFPSAVKHIRSLVGVSGTQQLADLLLTLIERGLDSDRVLLFIEALLS